MPSKETNFISHRVLMSNAIKFRDGKLFIWDIPGAIFSNYAFAYQFGILNHMNNKQGIDAIYWMSFYQAYGASIVIKKKFGIQQKVLENVVGQGEMLGHGKVFIKRADFEKAEIIIEVKSSIAEEFLTVFGVSKKAICHHIRGLIAGTVSYLTGKDIICIEKECIAKGNKICVFIAKPKKDFDSMDEVIKFQTPETFPAPDTLGDKRKLKILK